MHNDYVLIARLMIPTDAHVIRGCLEAAGIDVILTDDQHMQANLLLAPAIGGARVLVREKDAARAHDILAAYERGDLALSDDADVGAPAVE
ncbi:putative signal transducing protein [Janthinobacterium sp. HLX7-2]|uniref:putative signal transducing protein n=1 Tax=Janthinobacterium sp. HLX7-2 TaxID=1259331 RepID=UPI003F21AF39